MVRSLRTLSRNLDDLKKDPGKYSTLFGEGFGKQYDTTHTKTMELRVGDCKTTLDHYARFLRGVDSRLAGTPIMFVVYVARECNYSAMPSGTLPSRLIVAVKCRDSDLCPFHSK